MDLLECAACHGDLAWSIAERDGQRIEHAGARCAACGATYFVRDGIGSFLTPDLARNDLWDAGGGIAAWLRERPDAARRLMQSPLEALNAADRLLRAFALEEAGDFGSAAGIAPAAMRDLYTDEYRECLDREIRYVLGRLAGCSGPIVDIASGRCYLAEAMARELRAPIVATDFSPRILRRDRGRLQLSGLYDRVSLLACDARRSPFRGGAVTAMTSNLGLANIEQPAGLADELRRVLGGTFLSICCFYPEDDGENARTIRAMGAGTLLFRRAALAYFAGAGLHAEVVDACTGVARPTPRSTITGLPIDLLPVVDTKLDWCVLAIT